ncbi:hypothetical protein HYALB_00003630 [Hymenoscyphus albidus]|uniref:Uncharacterized protein n=1 Tax=Hymenoscyphus albidus TaxID=595503 RepID=A0A9N9M165_9HELO|nr:hypothetical protein HYALB_00003630 [Hymenoscyphus albidus]
MHFFKVLPVVFAVVTGVSSLALEHEVPEGTAMVFKRESEVLEVLQGRQCMAAVCLCAAGGSCP